MDKLTDFRSGVHGRVEALEKVALRGRLAVDEDLVRVVRLDNKRVELGRVFDDGGDGHAEVLLLPLLGHGVLVAEDEVHLIDAK